MIELLAKCVTERLCTALSLENYEKKNYILYGNVKLLKKIKSTWIRSIEVSYYTT